MKMFAVAQDKLSIVHPLVTPSGVVLLDRLSVLVLGVFGVMLAVRGGRGRRTTSPIPVSLSLVVAAPLSISVLLARLRPGSGTAITVTRPFRRRR